MKGKRYYMKNIKRKLWILAIILCGYMGFGIKAYAADEQWFAQQVEKLAKEGNVYIVAQDGTGDFLTIQEGVDAVNSGDTLIICPGVYEENVQGAINVGMQGIVFKTYEQASNELKQILAE